MLHAPLGETENKRLPQRTATMSTTAGEPGSSLGDVAGPGHALAGADNLPPGFHVAPQPRTHAKLQSAYGNQAVLRMLKRPGPSRPLLQRKCSCGGGGGECATCEEKGQTSLRRSARGSGTPDVVPPIVHEVLRSGGNSLGREVRSFMEPRFRHDFSHVRVHTDSRAAESARAVNALAYTVGRDVVFGAGQYAPSTNSGRRLLAHELTHVLQQSGVGGVQTQLTTSTPGDDFEQEADTMAERVMAGREVSVKPSPPGALSQKLQRDLATPPPAVPAPAQPDLTASQIQAAIAFNRARYDAANTRLIQDLLGGPVTGVWTDDNIVAIAATQEEYGLTKDGKVGPELFRFLNNEQTLEGMPTTTPNCLTSFQVIGPGPVAVVRTSPTTCALQGHFRTASQFSSRCNCSQFQYRQFIRGHFHRDRGGVVTDFATAFAGEPGGRLPTAFVEDTDTRDVPPSYGHRNQPADNNPEDHYINDLMADDQRNGCRYRNEDRPGMDQINDCRAGDVFDVDMNFRGEIQRNGTPIETKFWTAIRGRFTAPP